MNMGVGTGRKPRLFYGWWIVLAGFVAVACGTGSQYFTISQLFVLGEKLDSTTNQTVGAMGIFSGAGLILLLAIGPLIDRFGPRKLMLIGIPVASSSFIALGFVNSLFTLYILLGTLAIGISAAFNLPVQTATANWFIKRRSIALAAICAAPVLGGLIVNLLGIQITDLFDIQGAFLGLGIVILLIGIPLALVIRHRPEQHGYVPDGKSPIIKETVQPAIEKDTHLVEVNFSLRQALRTKAFWLLTIAIGLATGAGIMANSFRDISLFEEFDSTTTTNIFALAGLVGIFLFGFLGDKFPKRYLLSIAIALQSMSAVIMTARNTPQLYLYMLVYGFGSGIVPLILAIRADYFGRKAFATITAVMGFASGIISASFPIFGGLILDITGSYQTFFLLSMLIGFIAAVMFFFAKPPESPQQVSTAIES